MTVHHICILLSCKQLRLFLTVYVTRSCLFLSDFIQLVYIGLCECVYLVTLWEHFQLDKQKIIRYLCVYRIISSLMH